MRSNARRSSGIHLPMIPSLGNTPSSPPPLQFHFTPQRSKRRSPLPPRCYTCTHSLSGATAGSSHPALPRRRPPPGHLEPLTTRVHAGGSPLERGGARRAQRAQLVSDDRLVGAAGARGALVVGALEEPGIAH